MKWKNLNTDMELSIEGLGLVFYSDGAVKNINIGDNYLNNEYWEADKVASHIKKGDIVGFGTDGAGDFELRFRSGYPDECIIDTYPALLQLGIEVMGDKINVIDLYWLMDWQNDCPNEQQIEIEPGFYHITLCGEKPSWVVEEELSEEEYDEYIDRPRVIYTFLNKLEEMPKCEYTGVPSLYWKFDEE